MEATEGWTLAWLVGLQLLVAFWWWRGPALPGTRFSVCALLVLNAFAMAAASVAEVTAEAAWAGAANVADRWTNVLLLAVAIGAIERKPRWGPYAIGAVAIAGVVQLGLTPSFWENRPLPGGSAIELLMELPLLAAITATAVSMAFGSDTERADGRAWLLLSALFAVRFADLAVSVFIHRTWRTPFSGNNWMDAQEALRLLAVAALVFAVLASGLRLRRAAVSERPLLVFATTAVGVGFLVGSVKIGIDVPTTLLFITVALARPLVLPAIQAELEGIGLWEGARWRFLRRAGLAFLGSTVVLVLSAEAWRLQPVPTFALGASAAGVLLAASHVRSRVPNRNADVTPLWLSLEPAALPPDWRERLADAERRFGTLPVAVQRRLAALPHWKRILLALEDAPSDSRAYERSTPGLHLATHCPYAAIGPEIARTNLRWRTILREAGVPPPKFAPSDDASLVRVTYGSAEGLRSRRANLYSLTEAGAAVAAAIRRNLGVPEGESTFGLMGIRWADSLTVKRRRAGSELDSDP